jgi:hypothetical protein
VPEIKTNELRFEEGGTYQAQPSDRGSTGIPSGGNMADVAAPLTAELPVEHPEVMNNVALVVKSEFAGCFYDDFMTPVRGTTHDYNILHRTRDPTIVTRA